MRKFVMLSLFCCAAAAAADTSSGLDRLAALLPGVWQTEGQTFDSPVTKAGTQRYTTRRDCWREADAYRCISVVNGTLQLYDTFTWDASTGVYHQTRITPQGAQPTFTISVKADTWTYDQDISRGDGTTMHLRIVRTYGTGNTNSYDESFSSDGKSWVDVAKGSESHIDAGK